MPLDSQFSLSVELTRLIPFGPLASLAGQSLIKVARELSRTGSDIVVEEDLANIIGRNKIDNRFQSTFRTVVRESTSHQFGAFLDIVLNSGAGPTVQRSLHEARYFSTVVQLSLLSWQYNVSSLASGLSAALERRLDGAPLEEREHMSVLALTGTVRACREQTAAFDWNLLHEAVVSVLVKSNVFDKDWNIRQGGEGMPVAIIQGLLDFLPAAQYFPDERIIHITLALGKSMAFCTLIIWAHHVLGMTVTVSSDTGSATFGSGMGNIFLFVAEDVMSQNICLLDQHREEVFRISCDKLDMEIQSDVFIPVRGCAVSWLKSYNSLEQRQNSLDILESLRHALPIALERLILLGHDDYRLRATQAAKLMFGNSIEDGDIQKQIDSFNHEITLQAKASMESGTISKEINWAGPDMISEDYPPETIKKRLNRGTRSSILPLIRTLTALAFVEDLEAVNDLRISFKAMNFTFRSTVVFGSGIHYRFPFHFMAALLLGNDTRDEMLESSALVSSSGWSVFTNIFALPDPVFTSKGLIRVQKGVPTLGGQQKRYVQDVRQYITLGSVGSPPIGTSLTDSATPKLVSTIPADRGRWYIGTTESTFEVGIRFTFRDDDEGMKQRGCQFLASLTALETMGNNLERLSACEHSGSQIGSSYNDLRGFKTCGIPLPDSYLSSGSKFLFSSAGDKWARWMALQHFSHMKNHKPFIRKIYLRDQRGCPNCAMKAASGARHPSRRDIIGIIL